MHLSEREAREAEEKEGRTGASAHNEGARPVGPAASDSGPPTFPVDPDRLSPEEQAEVLELRQRDLEVRAHEHAHASAGGAQTSAPRYEFETGPDGVRYAVGGEVAVRFGKGNTPEETIRTAEQARRAALAPAEPSAQDLAVAAKAAKLIQEARAEQEGSEKEVERTGGQRAAHSERDTKHAIDVYRDVIRRGTESAEDGSASLLA